MGLKTGFTDGADRNSDATSVTTATTVKVGKKRLNSNKYGKYQKALNLIKFGEYLNIRQTNVYIDKFITDVFFRNPNPILAIIEKIEQ
jgi:hypothetical protein